MCQHPREDRDIGASPRLCPRGQGRLRGIHRLVAFYLVRKIFTNRGRLSLICGTVVFHALCVLHCLHTQNLEYRSKKLQAMCMWY